MAEQKMNLSGLLPLVHEIPAYRSLIEELSAGKPSGQERVVLEAAKPYLLACLHRDLATTTLVLTARPEKARLWHDELASWCRSEVQVVLFPEPDALPYERLASDPYIVQQRLRVLSLLTSDQGPYLDSPEKLRFSGNCLVVASVHAAAGRTTPPGRFAASCHTIRKGMRLDRDRTLARWMGLGYELEPAVEVPGTMSRRGGIVDIYSPHHNLPARIELFGDEVESIRWFDPTSQRSLGLADEITIIPASELLLPQNLDDALSRLDLSKLGPEAGERTKQELALLRQQQRFQGIDFYSSLVNDSALSDYLPRHSLLVLDQPDLVYAELDNLLREAAEMRQHQVERGELPPDFPSPLFPTSELEARLDGFAARLELTEWGDESLRLPFHPAPSYAGRLPALLEEVKALARGRRLIIASQQAPRLAELLEEQGIFAPPTATLEQPPPPGSVVLAQGAVEGGWVLDNTVLLSDSEVFGYTKKRRTTPKRPIRREAFLSELEVGDYVVHIDHGIGRFSGVVRMAPEGVEREYLVLDYAAGDKLYVPGDQMDRVGRYLGPGGYVPALSRLGTQEWSRTKERVREATGKLAQELLELYSAREVVPGIAFSADSPWQQELEASFPYVETADQLEAVRAVKQNMEQARPMDRLVCGDVGYGKTEVALRAAFKAVMEGMQVAVLVPTTVLAQQHFTTFSERLDPFPVVVEHLSRFRSPKEQQEVVRGLASGAVDICIGTHRLLQKDISFKNLGLVTIDEEQRFGVAHKERLKQLRKEVDVLTLSATPIPRTLHMSLIGVRDLSTMETPPEERLPIKTYVSAYDERLIREAVLRELDRNGQVFFVHNRVRRIGWVASRLEQLIPEARIAIAHGQMPEEALESVMFDFTQGKIDLLVCTTIIESGLDLPNVNTLIVDNADRLGLTQLYQLRGRVGRGAARAYAYFFFPRGKCLTEAAEKRLRTIFEATELGAGFRIALKDLEIRGAGNLLGPEQSGQMGAVGFDLYSRLLTEAVAELKGGAEGKPSPPPSPTVDLPLTAYIPEEYISDLSSRLVLYQRMAAVITSEEVAEIVREMSDRFGCYPQPVENLLYALKIRALGAPAGVQSISTDGPWLIVKLRDDYSMRREKLQRAFGDGLRAGHRQLRLNFRRLGDEWQSVLEDVLVGEEYFRYSLGPEPGS